ncbi:MAG TPA: GntG family PLP-dependent aldolase [Chloroflexota bacterium]
MIDLRSDTVTLPTPEMREAMADAVVGDDVFGEDPTINALEQRGAALLGKEAGLFVPTGTMGNLIATTTHCRPGDSVILGDNSHIFLNEVGGMAELGGLVAHVLPDATGKLNPEQVAASIHSASMHTPGTRLICVENSHNFAGGVVSTPAELLRIRAVAERHSVPVHMDGARIFNAAVALGVPALDLARAADSVNFCFSKGLAAPVGSLLTGSSAFIGRARRKRKQLGGGMRQAGVLAAAAMVALDTMIDRLAEDHANARRLAEGLARLDGFQVELNTVQTNIVMADLPTAEAAAACAELLAERGVLALHIGVRRIRFVTHYGIEANDIAQALAAAEQVAGRLLATAG